MSAPILEIQAVSKLFGGLAANSDVSFQVEEGTILGLIGPNGAGKTTLFNCITGYYPPTKGEVRFQGRRMNGLEPDAVCKAGMARTWQKVRPLARRRDARRRMTPSTPSGAKRITTTTRMP